MAQSEFTKVTRLKLWAWRLIDWIVLFIPTIVYVFVGLFDEGTLGVEKFGLVSCVVVALIFTLFNVIAQKRLRCPLWILLIGLYIVMRDKLMPLIIILAVTTTMDDLVLTPLVQYYRSKLVAHKAIDERE